MPPTQPPLSHLVKIDGPTADVGVCDDVGLKGVVSECTRDSQATLKMGNGRADKHVSTLIDEIANMRSGDKRRDRHRNLMWEKGAITAAQVQVYYQKPTA